MLRARLFGGHITVIFRGRTNNHGYLTATDEQGETLDLTATPSGEPAIAASTSTTHRATARVPTNIDAEPGRSSGPAEPDRLRIFAAVAVGETTDDALGVEPSPKPLAVPDGLRHSRPMSAYLETDRG